MAYIVNSSGNGLSATRLVSRRALAGAFLAGVAFCLLALFEMGHPLLALWIGLAFFGWLFMAGAATAAYPRQD